MDFGKFHFGRIEIDGGSKPAEAKRAVDSVDGFDEKDGLETLIRKSLAIILGEK
jgi:RuvA, C-terminal domain